MLRIRSSSFGCRRPLAAAATSARRQAFYRYLCCLHPLRQKRGLHLQRRLAARMRRLGCLPRLPRPDQLLLCRAAPSLRVGQRCFRVSQLLQRRVTLRRGSIQQPRQTLRPLLTLRRRQPRSLHLCRVCPQLSLL